MYYLTVREFQCRMFSVAGYRGHPLSREIFLRVRVDVRSLLFYIFQDELLVFVTLKIYLQIVNPQIQFDTMSSDPPVYLHQLALSKHPKLRFLEAYLML
jgi:hypothetical protein